MSHPSQFTLLRTRRFLPFFITQLLGAFNDNIFKQSLILAILYKLAIEGDRSIWVNLCALLFILPFFLFSALGRAVRREIQQGRVDPRDQAR
ncbi:hypothetical protein QF045_002387 [Pseudomonas sp. W4I3]|nr:hypothetical protein [Pseudomonas sp. W4I3]